MIPFPYMFQVIGQRIGYKLWAFSKPFPIRIAVSSQMSYEYGILSHTRWEIYASQPNKNPAHTGGWSGNILVSHGAALQYYGAEGLMNQSQKGVEDVMGVRQDTCQPDWPRATVALGPKGSYLWFV